MKYLALCLLLASCASRKYAYDIKMTNPSSSTLYYENDTMAITFYFKPKYISFELYNKTDNGIKIIWDEVSMSVNGEAKRIIHYETGLDKINEIQPPTTIPPRTKLVDAFILSRNVKFAYSGGMKTVASIQEIFPVYDYGNKKKRKLILSMKGNRTTVYLPLYINNHLSAKTFEFVIQDIRKTK